MIDTEILREGRNRQENNLERQGYKEGESATVREM